MSKETARIALVSRERMYAESQDEASEIAARCWRVHALEWPPSLDVPGLHGGELVYATAIGRDWPGIEVR